MTALSPSEVSITENEFEAQYSPEANPLDANASWNGPMLETYGEELELVKRVDSKTPGRVWTILDCDGHLVVASGFHFVNRFGYIITKNPVQDGRSVTVEVED